MSTLLKTLHLSSTHHHHPPPKKKKGKIIFEDVLSFAAFQFAVVHLSILSPTLSLSNSHARTHTGVPPFTSRRCGKLSREQKTCGHGNEENMGSTGPSRSCRSVFPAINPGYGWPATRLPAVFSEKCEKHGGRFPARGAERAAVTLRLILIAFPERLVTSERVISSFSSALPLRLCLTFSCLLSSASPLIAFINVFFCIFYAPATV